MKTFIPLLLFAIVGCQSIKYSVGHGLSNYGDTVAVNCVNDLEYKGEFVGVRGSSVWIRARDARIYEILLRAVESISIVDVGFGDALGYNIVAIVLPWTIIASIGSSYNSEGGYYVLVPIAAAVALIPYSISLAGKSDPMFKGAEIAPLAKISGYMRYPYRIDDQLARTILYANGQNAPIPLP